MIELRTIEVRGVSASGPFVGRLDLGSGLQVISTRNTFGKSLAVKAIAWCLGLEAIYGRPDNDPSLFPLAVRDGLNLTEDPEDLTVTPISQSAASITLRRGDGQSIRLTREIKGDPTTVQLEEFNKDEESQKRSRMHARRNAMRDEHGGLQAFLFDWLNWPRQTVPTYRGAPSEVYAENLAPLFYIEQNHGWGDLQATQIGRYQQQQIGEIAVEYLLGSTAAIDARFEKAQALAREAGMVHAARLIADRVQQLFRRQGWAVDWSAQGALSTIEKRWKATTLKGALEVEAKVNLSGELDRLSTEADRLRTLLTGGDLDSSRLSASASASQRVVDLKQRQHELNVELQSLRAQLGEAKEVRQSIQSRLRAAVDVLQLKSIGVGRLETVECPTCHRDIDATLLALSIQSPEAVSAHIESLRRDAQLVHHNANSMAAAVEKLRAEAEHVEAEFRAAQRGLQTVTAAIGLEREQLAEIANKLTEVERQVDRTAQTAADIRTLQAEIDAWISEVHTTEQSHLPPTDLAPRVAVFTSALRDYLVALGHSAVSVANAWSVRLDDRYEPYLGDLRLKALGSASDGARLIAAYSLALAAASADARISGHHPGIVVLDEPLQQNPDAKHRELFLAFLTKQIAKTKTFQTLIFTSLYPDEVAILRDQNVPVITPTSRHLLTKATSGG